MRQIAVADVAGNLEAVLDEVARGGEVVIMREGRPVARLVPDGVPARDQSSAEEAATRMTDRGRRLGLGKFDWDEWRGYRDEGRK